MTDRQLLTLYADVMEELRVRGTTRSTNNPVADYAEFLCARALGATLSGKSTKGYDALDQHGKRIQIKARRVTPHNASRQLGAIRGLNERPFDLLAGVVFDVNFVVMKACLISHDVVVSQSSYVTRTNSWRFLLRDEVWSMPGVEDVTARLQQAQE